MTRHSKPAFLALSLFTIVLAAGCSGGSGGSSSGPGGGGGGGGGSGGSGGGIPPSGYVVFAGDHGSGTASEPWLAALDGSELRPLAFAMTGSSLTLAPFSSLSGEERGGIAASPDGSYVVLISGAASNVYIDVLDVATNTSVPVFIDLPPTSPPRILWSPNSEAFLIEFQTTATQADIATYLVRDGGATSMRLNLNSEIIRPRSWSPTGDLFSTQEFDIAAQISSSKIYDDQGNLFAITTPPYDFQNDSWSSERYAFTASDPNTGERVLWQLDLQTLTVLPLSPPGHYVPSGRYSPDGAYISYSGNVMGVAGQLFVVDAILGGAPVSFGPGGNAIDWSPTEPRFAFGSSSGGSVANLFLGEATGQITQLTNFQTPGTSIGSRRWSPDGDYLAYGAGIAGSLFSAWVQDVRTGGVLVELVDPSANRSIFPIGWSPDSDDLYLIALDASTSSLLVAHPSDLSVVETIGEGLYSSLFAVLTSDSTGIVWVQGDPGSGQVGIRFTDPDDPASSRIVSSASNVHSFSTIRGMFVR